MVSDKIRWLKMNDVCNIVQFARQTIYKYVRNGWFPPPIKIKTANTFTNRWLASDVKKWIDLIESGQPVAEINWAEIAEAERAKTIAEGMEPR